MTKTVYEVFSYAAEAATIARYNSEAEAQAHVGRLGYNHDYEAVQRPVASRKSSPCYCDSAYHPAGH